MSKLKVGLIGTGKKQRASATNYAMAYQHAAAYKNPGQLRDGGVRGYRSGKR